MKDSGADASYYEIPPNCTRLYDIIVAKNMQWDQGNIVKAAYRWGEPQAMPEISFRPRSQRKTPLLSLLPSLSLLWPKPTLTKHLPNTIKSSP